MAKRAFDRVFSRRPTLTEERGLRETTGRRLERDRVRVEHAMKEALYGEHTLSQMTERRGPSICHTIAGARAPTQPPIEDNIDERA